VCAVVIVVVAAVAVTDNAKRPNPAPRGTTVPVPSATRWIRPAPGSPWTTPVSQLQPSPRSQEWSTRLIDHGGGTSPGNYLLSIGLGQRGTDYSMPIYDASTATELLRVREKFGKNGTFNVGPNDTVPFDRTWRPADGTDAFLLVEDPDSGAEWDFWVLSFAEYQTDETSNSACANAPHPTTPDERYDAARDLCAATALRITQPDGQPADMRTYTGNAPQAGGGGLPNAPGLVRPEEVAEGRIAHAWKLAIPNTMTGPACSTEQRGRPAALGTECGDAVSPAGQFERVANGSTPAQLGTQVPEGTRFSLHLDDAEITAWLDQRGYSGARRNTARIMAESLRDYGWFITDTAEVPNFALAGAANKNTAAQWRSLGLDDTAPRLLDGLITPGRVVAWDPPTSQCADGSTSRWYCFAGHISY
jgi:hypothetical protein